MDKRPKWTRIAKPAGLYRKEQQGEGQLRPVPELEKFRVGGEGCASRKDPVTGRDRGMLGEPSGQLQLFMLIKIHLSWI